MEVKKSPLELVNFNVLKSVYSFEHPTDREEIDVDELTENYVLDFDYMIKTSRDHLYAVFTKVIINDDENKLPGHTIFVEAVSLFRINMDYPDQQKPEDIKALINFSAVTLAFSNVRGYISDLTSYTPSGKYLFPIFDLQFLIKKKQEQMANLKKIKEAAKRKTPKKKVTTKAKKS